MGMQKIRNRLELAALSIGAEVLKKMDYGTVAVDPGSIAANTKGSKAVTIAGLAAGDMLILQPPSNLEAGLSYVGHEVTAANELTIYLLNHTGAAVDGASLSWRYLWLDLT